MTGQKLPKQERKAKRLISALDMDFSILLDNITIARSRKHVTKYYDTSEIGNFPQRLKPVSFYTDIAKKEDKLGYGEIFSELMNLTMGVYAPMQYIQPSKIEKYEDLYDDDVDGLPTLKQSNREKALQKLMTINMLKRLESCVESFRVTIKNVKKASDDTLKKIYEFEESGKNSQQELYNIDVDA